MQPHLFRHPRIVEQSSLLITKALDPNYIADPGSRDGQVDRKSVSVVIASPDAIIGHITTAQGRHTIQRRRNNIPTLAITPHSGLAPNHDRGQAQQSEEHCKHDRDP